MNQLTLPTERVSLTCPLSERAIKSRFKRLIFGNRTRCLNCGNFHVRWIEAEDRYWCPKCRKRFSLTSDSWLKGMKISWQKLYLILYLWQHEYDTNKASHSLSLSLKAIRHWYELFRAHIPPDSAYFQGNVEADESWFGYRSGARIKAAWRKVKIPVLGAYERETGIIKTKAVPKPTEKYLIPFITGNVEDGSCLITDSYRGYWQLPDLGYQHIRVDHYSKEYGPTNHIEGIWSVLKRKLRKIYYSVSADRFPEYLCEITYRFNTRKLNLKPLDFLANTKLLKDHLK